MKNREDKFRTFLDLLKKEDNALLIEAIAHGFSTICEGYADVVEPQMSALDIFNQKSSDLASAIGNDTMHFLKHSGQKLASKYSRDPDDGLEGNATNDMQDCSHRTQTINGHAMNKGVRQLELPDAVTGNKDEITDSLGLTIDEMNRA